MSKHIVFCADGTWNGPGQDEDGDGVPDITNVLKLFSALGGDDAIANLALADEQERVLTQGGTTQQIAKYIHGVGDAKNPLEKMLGGAFGAGVIARIVRGYTFVSRNYQEDDDIVLVGFSRGAYTARALAGLIASMGLLDPAATNLQDQEKSYKAGVGAWFGYREKALKNGPLRDRFNSCLAGFVSGLLGEIAKPAYRQVKIKAVAVWDTVGALGIPVYYGGEHMDVFRFADNILSSTVTNGIHAVSRDEQRKDFTPTLWDPRPDASIVQMLFAGAHADVGGGYPTGGNESGLSNIALHWMIEQLQKVGVRFAADPLSKLPPGDPLGVAHMPWIHAPWAILPSAPRKFPLKIPEHDSVKNRKNQQVKPDPSRREEKYV